MGCFWAILEKWASFYSIIWSHWLGARAILGRPDGREFFVLPRFVWDWKDRSNFEMIQNDQFEIKKNFLFLDETLFSLKAANCILLILVILRSCNNWTEASIWLKSVYSTELQRSHNSLYRYGELVTLN